MKKAAQRIQSSTQDFIEIQDIIDNVVIQAGGNACLIIEIKATNFPLLSKDEQDAKISSYAALLNSLSFPIQIFIRGRRIDVSSYLKTLDFEAQKTTNQKLSEHIKAYKDFVQTLVRVNIVLDKKFYLIVPYSYLENSMKFSKDTFTKMAVETLTSKAKSLQAELSRLTLTARTLDKEELISLFYQIYNEDSPHSNKISHATPDVIAPSSIEVDFGFIRIGEKFYKTFFVVGYPRYVSPNWLSPLIDLNHSANISMFVYPSSTSSVLSDFRRKIAEMEASISSDEKKGLSPDPKIQASLEDALTIQEELAKGIERFFQFGLYITLSSDSLEDLKESAKTLHATLSSMLIIIKAATLQMEEGFKSTIPLGQDKLYITRNMDTISLASTFPFTSAMLTQDKGIMYGTNEQNGSLIVFDRFSLENANEVVLGKSGSGKSYLIKLEAMRQFMFGTEVIIVDPEGEYETLCKSLGGESVAFTASSPIKINPFDLSGLYEEGENELGLKILSLHGLLKIVMGDLDAKQDAILDRALVETYRQKGITTDPKTQKKQPPIMEDLYKTLLGMGDQTASDLALRLEKFIKGSLSGIFNQQSNFDIKNQLTAFSIRALEGELRAIAMHIILDFVWTKIRKDLKKRLLIVDEAWYIMRYEDSASFVYGIAKRARKYFLALTTATQDVLDFLSTDYGKAVLSNSSIQVLLKQSPTEIDTIVKLFNLSVGEREILLSANVGEGLFFAGQNHVKAKIVAAPFEHGVITTNPQELTEKHG